MFDNTLSNWLMGAGGITLAVGLAPIALGFGTVGVAAGSIAAGIQSGIGLVSAGSTFATMTSFGMSGYFVGTSIGGAAAVATGIGVKLYPTNDSRDTQPENINVSTDTKDLHHENVDLSSNSTDPQHENVDLSKDIKDLQPADLSSDIKDQ